MKKKIMIVTNDTSNNQRSLFSNRLNSKYEFTYIDTEMNFNCLNEDNFIPDVILIDSQTSDNNGLGVFIDLKINPLLKDIPAIFLIDKNDKLNKFFIHDILDADYFLKPFKTKDLKKRINNILKEKTR